MRPTRFFSNTALRRLDLLEKRATWRSLALRESAGSQGIAGSPGVGAFLDLTAAENVHEQDLTRILQRENPFRADSIKEPRLVWDATVHKYFLDTCNFFLFRYRQTPPDEIKALQDEVTRLGIGSYYAYLLFGHFDALLRVWATAARINRLRGEIRKWAESGTLLEAREFLAQDYRLVFNGAIQTGPKISADGDGKDLFYRHAANINTIAKALNSGLSLSTEPLRQCLRELITDKLVHVANSNQSSAETFRFAVALLPEAGLATNVNLDEIVHWILDFNHAHQGKLMRAAVYHGIGYGEFLISGIVDSYEAMSWFSQFFRERIEGKRIRTETYLSSTSRCIVIDRIDPQQDDLSPVEVRLVSFLSSKERDSKFYHNELQKLDRGTREELHEVYNKNEASLLWTPFSDHFRDFLEARVCNENRRLASALAVLLEIEGLLCVCWVASWRKGGSELYGKVKDAASRVNIKDFDPNKPNLSNILDISRKLKKEGQDDLLSSAIGPTWDSVLEGEVVKRLRNDVAHGRVLVQADYLDKQWSVIAGKIGEIGQLYNSARIYFESLQKNLKQEPGR